VPLSKESKAGCPDDVEGHVEPRWSTLSVIHARLTLGKLRYSSVQAEALFALRELCVLRRGQGLPPLSPHRPLLPGRVGAKGSLGVSYSEAATAAARNSMWSLRCPMYPARDSGYGGEEGARPARRVSGYRRAQHPRTSSRRSCSRRPSTNRKPETLNPPPIEGRG
jgi:hypothetical protein